MINTGSFDLTFIVACGRVLDAVNEIANKGFGYPRSGNLTKDEFMLELDLEVVFHEIAAELF